MSPDDLHTLIRTARPEPPNDLRARVLAAATAVEPAPPWWAHSRTWTAAAAALLLVNWLVMSDGRAPATTPEPAGRALAFSPEEIADLPPLLAARLLQPLPPMPGNAPNPRTPLEEILR